MPWSTASRPAAPPRRGAIHSNPQSPGVGERPSRSTNRGITLAAWLLFAAAFPAIASAVSALQTHPSPYLRDHARDAIQWRAPEADVVGESRRSGKPILVSSGYLACYWCYRLKADTLGDQALAELVNARFVPVLLDREFHPGDDRLLQAFLQRVRGAGGWPVIAVVSPDGEPVHAWSYLPPGALRAALVRFIESWEADADTVSRAAARDNARARPAAGGAGSSDIAAFLEAFLSQVGAASDWESGGFGRAEKYPHVPQLQAMLDLHQQNPSDSIAGFLGLTLDHMLSASLVDPLEGGVFRYTENRDWTSPHYEQMLYTQVLFARLLLRAADALGERRFIVAADHILDNLLERFAGTDGWMASSLSAVGGGGVNGAYYLLPERAIATHLGDGWSRLVETRLRVDDRLLVAPVGPLAGVTRETLVRLRRDGGLLRDDKRLLSWNGLALSALSHGAGLDARYRDAAERLAMVLIGATEVFPLAMTGDGDGNAHPADLSAYVYVAGGLFDWWQVSADAVAARRAALLLDQAAARYHGKPGWRTGATLILADPQASPAIQDSQLPSPSAEWLRLADALALSGFTLTGRTQDVSARMAASWPASLPSEAFFHATLVSALVTGRFLGIH